MPSLLNDKAIRRGLPPVWANAFFRVRCSITALEARDSVIERTAMTWVRHPSPLTNEPLASAASHLPLHVIATIREMDHGHSLSIIRRGGRNMRSTRARRS